MMSSISKYHFIIKYEYNSFGANFSIGNKVSILYQN